MTQLKKPILIYKGTDQNLAKEKEKEIEFWTKCSYKKKLKAIDLIMRDYYLLTKINKKDVQKFCKLTATIKRL